MCALSVRHSATFLETDNKMMHFKLTFMATSFKLQRKILVESHPASRSSEKRVFHILPSCPNKVLAGKVKHQAMCQVETLRLSQGIE